MKKLHAIAKAAKEWLDENPGNRSCIILTHDELGHPYGPYFHPILHTSRSDLKFMLFCAFKDEDFLRAAKEAMEERERANKIPQEPATFA